MTFLNHVFRTHRQLVFLSLWIAFVGWSMWQHAQHSQQPPIYDAFSYYLKAHNFWAEMQQQKLFHYFNVEPSFRPPGTILMSYPFGFDTDYRGFYFRSVFFPIVLLSLAVVIGGYRRELDSKSKWHLALIAVFLSCLPCFYHFEVSPTIPASDHWGLVDNFLAGMAALAAAAAIRSCWTGSLAWVGLAAILSSFCLLIKPVGILIMMLVGLLWFGLSMLNLKSTWASPGKRKSASRWLLNGMVIFAVPYLLVLAVSFTSHYLSSSNLAYGNAAIVVMRNEIPLSWIDVMFRVHEGPGFPFMAWLLLMLTLVAGNNWRMSAGVLPWSRPTLIGLALASCGTFVFGIWFWLFGSGGATQTRYFIPFVLMAAILALPAILTAVRGLAGWKAAILSVFMIAPVINSAMLLLQRHAPAEWQQWAGVNLTAGAADPVMLQAQHFVDGVKHEGGSNVVLYSISMNMADSFFSAAIEYAGIAMPPMPIRSMVRPVDWQRPSTYRKKEMLDTDYWLFQPVRDPEIRRNMLAKPSIDTFEQEKALFEAWATQLTADEGVVTVSDTPSARVLRIADLDLLEPAFDALVAAHHWRDAFTAANPKRLFNEVDLAAALAQNPPSLENVDFSGRFQIRAISLGRTGDEITLRFWWKPLSPLPDQDWAIFIHSIDAEGKIVRATGMPIRFNRPLSALNGAVLFDQITISNPVAAGTPRLAFGFVRPNQAPLIADRGARDWDSRRVIVSAP